MFGVFFGGVVGLLGFFLALFYTVLRKKLAQHYSTLFKNQFNISRFVKLMATDRSNELLFTLTCTPQLVNKGYPLWHTAYKSPLLLIGMSINEEVQAGYLCLLSGKSLVTRQMPYSSK